MSKKITQKMIQGYAGKPQDKGLIVRDSELKGFGLRISPKGAISFIVEARPRGKGGSAKRITVGKYPAFSLSQAREEARETLRILYAGDDPRSVRKAQIDTTKESDSYTLRKVLGEFLERRDLKDSTRKDYRQGLRLAYSDFLDQPIQSITRRDVEETYWRLEKRALSTAQRTSRILSSIMNYAKGIELSNGDRLIKENPVEVLKDKGVKRTLKRKDTVIPPEELLKILETLAVHTTGSFSDDPIGTNRSFLRAFYVLALTGSRKMEVFSLRKKDVHLSSQGSSESKISYLQFNDTKNHQTHYVPITENLLPIIKDAMKTKGPWLFPQKNNTLHIVNPSKAVRKYLSIRDENGEVVRSYTLHDFRRTFLTVGSEIGVDTMSLKKLVNHKISGDVTDGYIIQRKEQRLKLTLGNFEAIQEEMLSLAHTFPTYTE